MDPFGARPCFQPSAGQELDFDLLSGFHAKMLQDILAERHLSPRRDGQCGHGKPPSIVPLHYNANLHYCAES